MTRFRQKHLKTKRKGPTRSMRAGRDRSPTPVRCTKRVPPGPETRCGWRGTLPKQPSEYAKHPPKCPRCGTPITYIDFRRVRKEWKVKPCRCYGYAFPHARGRGYCDHNPKLTAEDLRIREEGGPRREANDAPF